jgi:hypothetical protein
VSSSDHFPDIPRTRDGAPNWAADTDPVGPVTPELALVDPGLTSGQINNEVTMSSMQFGDGTAFNPTEPAHAPLEAPQTVPLQSIPPLAPPAPAPAPAPPTPVEPAAAMAVSDMRDVPLGTLVFRAGLLPEERLEEALQEGMKTGKRLGEILLERGWVSEVDLGRLLAGQKGLPFVELDPAAVDPTAPPLLHPEKARLHGALPIGFQGGIPVVAVADPSNDLVIENVRRALACEPTLVVAGRDALHRAINLVYGADAPEQAAPAAPVAEAAPTALVTEPVVPVVEPVAVAPVVEPVAVAPVVEPVAVAPVVEPVAVAPIVEPVAAPPVAEPIAPIVEPVAPAVEPVAQVSEAPAPVEQFAPVEPAPVAPEFIAPPLPAVEPEAVTPVAPEPVVETVAEEPVQNGDGVWLGQPEAVQQSVAPVPMEPVIEVAAPEPFVAQPEAVPVVPAAPAAQEPVVPEEPASVAPEPTPDPDADSDADLTWMVVLRLADGERLEVDAFRGEAEAVDGARTVVNQIASEATWPFFAGRFIRPEAIISVDLVQLEATRWLGSSARAGAFRPDPQQPPTS